ncbi:MAG: type II toxin-antitoxin system HicA family toxin [Acidimicrobiia bacterium]|nr:type II toxin-antitoxin system HicA family toxin [Acidimicrobiia bacterium]
MASLPMATCHVHRKVFEALGWTYNRTTGSHIILTRRGHKTLSLVCHAGKNMSRGTLRQLVRAAGLTDDEYLKAFNKHK